MRASLDADGLREALESWAAKWIERMRPRCDWCGTRFVGTRDLREYLDWCMTLREAWPSELKQQPAARVFCVPCAVGAINELHGGPRYVARRDPAAYGAAEARHGGVTA